MIEWFGLAQIVLAAAAALLCLGLGLAGRAPNDYVLGATVLVTLALAAQIVVAVVQPFVGNPPRGDALEYWMYLVIAFLMPIGAGFWALIDRSRWATLALALVHASLAVMVYRMLVIWG